MKLMLAAIIIIFFCGCNRCKPKDKLYTPLLNMAKAVNKNIPDVNWEVLQSYSTDIEDYIALSYNQHDTSFFLRLYKSNLSDTLSLRKFYLIFEKSYSINDTVYKLIMDTDTLCYYKYPAFDSIQKSFFVGKYYFQYSDPYEMERFKLGQHSFFQNHLDSLVKIRGNDLPELPCDSSFIEQINSP